MMSVPGQRKKVFIHRTYHGVGHVFKPLYDRYEVDVFEGEGKIPREELLR